MDLDAVVAVGWAEPAQFSEAEFARASEFWFGRRREDARLAAVQSRASELVRSWTGRIPRDVGSFGIQTNLETSDLDLGIGFPMSDREYLLAAMSAYASFKGERYTRFDTTRLVFAFVVDDVEIDVSALTEEDFAVACRMLDEINAGMSQDERIAHTWVKYLLKRAGRAQEYAAWKLVTYARFCPEFNWVPIPETTAG